MALFGLKWLRRIVRRNTKPIDVHQAALWKKRLSLAYAVTAWHLFGYVFYLVYTGRNKPEEERKEYLNMTTADKILRSTNMERGKIIRYSGLTRIDETYFDNTAKKKEEIINSTDL